MPSSYHHLQTPSRFDDHPPSLRHDRIKTSAIAIVYLLLAFFFVSPLSAQEEQPKSTRSEALMPLTTPDYLMELEKLAAKCDELGLTLEAKWTRQWWPQERSDQLWMAVPNPAELEGKSTNADLAKKWLDRFRNLRSRHALHLLEIASEKIQQDLDYEAYRLVWRAFREDPDNQKVRFVLNTLINSNDAAAKPRLSITAHPKLGWGAKTFHRCQLPHFRIVSNAAPDEISRWAEELERIYSLWTQMYPELWLAPNVLKNRLAGKNVPLERKIELNFVLFRSREEYLQHLGQNETRIDTSVGYYAPKDSISYFYIDPSGVPQATIIHELTHQILQEASLIRGGTPWESPSDFWAVEAIALHAESLWIGTSLATVGGWESPRLQVARYRMLRDDFWIDWDELRQYSSTTWKEQKEISKSYTQSAGLAHFWLDHRQPENRQAFIAYLQSVYREKPTPDILTKVIPVSAWKESYQTMLQTPAKLLNRLNPDRPLKECVLIGCKLDEKGMKFLEGQGQLEWLDLAFVDLQDQQLEVLKQLPRLTRLNLEGTPITDASAAYLGELKMLEELDLSQTKIGDEGITKLKDLDHLATLWLTGTAVTDESLEVLGNLPKLEFLQVDGSQISAEKWKSFLTEQGDLNKNSDDSGPP
jgi:hypothetical protein